MFHVDQVVQFVSTSVHMNIEGLRLPDTMAPKTVTKLQTNRFRKNLKNARHGTYENETAFRGRVLNI